MSSQTPNDHVVAVSMRPQAGRSRSVTGVLDQNRDAVRAALTLPYHNGGTEGVNTKTKRIMRQMHGRAGFALLRHRILLA
jgi:transposase